MKNKTHAGFSLAILKKIGRIVHLCLVMAVIQLIGVTLLVPTPTEAADPPTTVRVDRVRHCTQVFGCDSTLTRSQYSYWDAAGVSDAKQRDTYLAIVSEPPKGDVHNLVFLTSGRQTDDGQRCNVTGQPDNFRANWDDTVAYKNISFAAPFVLSDVYKQDLFNPADTFIGLAFDANYRYGWTKDNLIEIQNAFYNWLKSKFDANNIQNIYLLGHSRGGCLVMQLSARFNKDFPNANIIVQAFDPVCNRGNIDGEFGVTNDRIYNPYYGSSTDRYCYKTDVAAQYTNNKTTGLLHNYILAAGAEIFGLDLWVRGFSDKDAYALHNTKGNWFVQDWTPYDHQEVRLKPEPVQQAINHLKASIIYPPPIPALGVAWLDQGANTGDNQKISLHIYKASPDDEAFIQCQGSGCGPFGWTLLTDLVDTQIPDDQLVQYRVKARNTLAESEWSRWFNVSVGDRTPPSPFPLMIKLISNGLNSGDTQSVEVETDEATSPWEFVEYETYTGEPYHHRDPSNIDFYRTPADVHDNQTYGIRGRMWDVSGNYSSWVKVSVNISDYTSPTVTDVTGDIAICDDPTISATLADNVSVFNASLYYTPIGGTETLLDFSTGSAAVPIDAISIGDIPYYITARDIRGNSVRSPQSGNYTITVLDPNLDSDGDTIGDCDDGCPFDSNRVSPDFGGCGLPCSDLMRNESTMKVFAFLQAAINDPDAVNYDNIQITTADLNEDVVYDRDIILTLSGGYYCNFSDNAAMSSITSLVIKNGTVITDKLIIRSL